MTSQCPQMAKGSYCLEPLWFAEGFPLPPLAADSREALLPCFAPEPQKRLSLSADPFEGLLSCLPLLFASALRIFISDGPLLSLSHTTDASNP